jgi:beta-mannanase
VNVFEHAAHAHASIIMWYADWRVPFSLAQLRDGLAASGRPVRLRFAQEMSGSWYPWDERANGNRPGDFIAMWRHVHHLFTLAGARNVTWVWSPVTVTRRATSPGGAGSTRSA